MTRLIYAVTCLLAGAVIFWGPDLVVHAWAGNNFSGVHVLTLTIVLPLLASLAFCGTGRSYPAHAKWAPLLMVMGIWIFGGLAMLLAASFSNGGFFRPERLSVILMSMLPPFTVITSTYDGTLAALLLTTVIGLVISIRRITRDLFRIALPEGAAEAATAPPRS